MGIPYLWMEVRGQAQRIGPGGVPGPVAAVRYTANGIGDITIYPFMLSYPNSKQSADSKVTTSGSNLDWRFEPLVSLAS